MSEAERQAGDTDPEALRNQAWGRAKAANAAAGELRSSTVALRDLSRANAFVVAVMSIDGDGYPTAVPPQAMLGVANLLGSLAQEWLTSADQQAALDRYVLALEAVRKYRTYARGPVPNVDRQVFALASKAAAIVGELAAERRLALNVMLQRLDEHIVTPYCTLTTENDLTGPRAFAAISMVRQALLGGDAAYIGALRDELLERRHALIPVRVSAAKRFESDLDALLDEVEVRLGEKKRGAFQW